jgi:sugar phosphate isomerase/epimerase
MNAYESKTLAYCSNVHPGEKLDDVIENIRSKFSVVKVQRGLTEMASGLWLSAKAADTLVNSTDEMSRFKRALASSGMLLTSLNGFPFGNFHQDVVKKSVYLPDWAQTERIVYSKNIATILAECLPEGCEQGAISTLPLGYANVWSHENQQIAVNQLIELSCFLQKLEQETGKHICFGIEMEPDCVLETTAQLVKFFHDDLLPVAGKMNIKPEQILRYIGCCFDTCHQAVMNENIYQSLTVIETAGIRICKIQISNALSAQITTQQQIKQLTDLFFDIKFLHQTKVFLSNKTKRQDQNIIALADLSLADLRAIFNQSKSTSSELQVKIHYHIPIHQMSFSLDFLSSTQYAILQALDYLNSHEQCRPVLEVETYTWLNFVSDKDDQNKALITGLVNEFTWLQTELVKRGLLD